MNVSLFALASEIKNENGMISLLRIYNTVQRPHPGPWVKAKLLIGIQVQLRAAEGPEHVFELRILDEDEQAIGPDILLASASIKPRADGQIIGHAFACEVSDIEMQAPAEYQPVLLIDGKEHARCSLQVMVIDQKK
jgi:hypothetical protein